MASTFKDDMPVERVVKRLLYYLLNY